MSGCYWKRGVTNYITLQVWANGVGKTGLVNADFTKLLWRNGVTAAVTGITISEVDATDFPGRYIAEVSGANGFVSGLGQFELLIHWSSQTSADGYVASVTVTTDGTGAGSWGGALFSATAGDGRVTDGVSALEGVPVYIFGSSGLLMYMVETDSNGLWSLALPEDDTYGVYVQRGGYSVAEGTLVVSGGVAAGPGVDLEITALSTGTGYTLAELQAYTLRQWFDKSDAQAEEVSKEIVNAAIRYVATDRDWPWYNRTISVTLNPPYTEGTIAILNGTTTVTLTGGTWPTWATDGRLVINGMTYQISARVSDTVLTLAHAWSRDDITAQAYTLGQFSVTLPAGGVYSITNILGGSGWPYPMTPIDYGSWSTIVDQFPTGGGPYNWTLWRNKMAVWPFYQGTEARTWNLVIKAKPSALVTGTDEADWDPTLPDILYRAIDLHITHRGSCRAGDTRACAENYTEARRRASGNDRGPGRYDINHRSDATSYSRVDMATRSVTP